MDVSNHETIMSMRYKDLNALFVDDEVVISMGMLEMLKRRFNEVFLADNGIDGLEAFKAHKPDIVITDIVMPEMNGVEMITEIRALSPDTPVLVMSAVNERHYLEQLKGLKVNRFVGKPISEAEFFGALFEAIKEWKSKEKGS